jgi:glycosyltransferase involved in cell wall biosynthesis
LTSPASGPGAATRAESENLNGLTVSVVVCTRHRAAKLRECLAGVRRLSPAPADVLVVDNSAGDEGTRQAAAEAGARYTVEPIAGLSRARNKGMAECTSEIVAYLDDDAIPDVRWLEYLIEPFAASNVGAVTGRVRTPDSRPTAAAENESRMVSNQDEHWFEIATFGGLGLGSNMALRRSACPAGSLFDERLGRGAPFQIAEESYAFAVILSRGYRAAYTARAIVDHPPMRRGSLEQEARNSLTYWLLLFSEFPGRRLDLLRFLLRRLRRKPLTWPRDPQGPGEIVSAGWGLKLKAGWTGLLLFLRTPKATKKAREEKPQAR